MYKNNHLTSSEVAVLWSSYMNDTMIVCGARHFLTHAEDPDVRELLEFTLQSAGRHIAELTRLFEQEDHPLPDGFSDKDVNLAAPRLYSDVLILFYLLNMAKFGLNANSMALGFAEREDVVAYYGQCLEDSKQLHDRAKLLTQQKGLYVRSPRLPTPDGIEYVRKTPLLNGIFAKERPLFALEIAHLVHNLKRNAIGKALMIGFSQVAGDSQLRRLFERGRDMARKHVEVFHEFLNKDYLPTPMIWDAEITTSTVSPFSDKLMLFHASTLISSGLGQYGVSISQSPRKDLAAAYSRLALEIADYAEDAAKLAIDRGWMEKPPQAVDRRELARS